MKFYLIITTLFSILITAAAFSSEAVNYKIYKCEKVCRERYETCSLKASMKKGKEKNKVAAICETRLFDCRERCRRIK